jgi:hypothetical protein
MAVRHAAHTPNGQRVAFYDALFFTRYSACSASSVAALSDPQHHVPGNWIAQLLSDVARVFRALAPVIRVIDDGYAHDCVTLSAFRPASSAE